MNFKLFLAAILLATSTLLTAQSNNYRHLEWDLLRLGYTAPSSEFYNGGAAMGTEVRFNATDNLSAGIRLELAFYTSDLDADVIDIGAASSTLITGDYYLKRIGGFRPFAGVGIGMFTGASATVRDLDNLDPEDFSGGRGLGLTPRLGLELGHFRVSAEYNYTFSNRVSNYFSIMVAPTLFGGPKDDKQH
ncbi:outer membrane beta-barrel protein [Lewinella sp. IMCC34183]|uniref:outer membrane beta-barrel protein n=1 Tax=Lewinella sp. IMCC34183 TaxID=2248762 RepID=UPI000E21FA6D|nr:outer membrane beta-barrel protein [Lewinella sp. IMCC34183]